MALDIEGFITRNYEYQYYGRPVSDIKINCPFCEYRVGKYDTKFHLHISLKKQAVHCFRCGYSSSWIKFVMDALGCPYHLALGELYVVPRIRGDVKETIKASLLEEEQEDFLQQFTLPGDFQLLYDNDNILVRMAKRYVVRRGFTEDHMIKYNLGYSNTYPARVIIPIERDYWQGRSIVEWMMPKYINPKEPARDVLFNFRAMEMYNEIVVCEGAFSAMAVGENAIALIGKEPTEEKIERMLASDVEKFCITLEPEAFSTIQKLADRLAKGGRRVIIWKYKEGDPADKSPFVEMEYNLKSKVQLMISDKF